MRIPRLSRRQKTVRNLLLILAALALWSWEMDFPAWTRAGILRRAEQVNLLETPSEILYEDRDLDGGTILARNGKYLLRTSYDHTLVGLRFNGAALYEEAVLLDRDYERGGRGERDYFYPGYTAMGLLKNVSFAEAELAIGGELNASWVIRGEKTAECRFDFCYTRQYEEGDQSPEALAEDTMLRGQYSSSEVTTTFRFYEENGDLLFQIIKDGYF